MSRPLVLVVSVGLLGCQSSASTASPTTLAFDNFWTFAGITRTTTPNELIASWGPPAKQTATNGEKILRYAHGPSVTFRPSGGLLIDLGVDGAAFQKTHPDPATRLLGMSCDEAGARLGFFGKPVPGYLTCKHYDANGWFLDVTLLCASKTVGSVVIMWEPLPPEVKAEPFPPDHCNV